MPAATPASIRSWMGRHSGCGRVRLLASGLVVVGLLASGFAVVSFMAPACGHEASQAIRKTPAFHPEEATGGLRVCPDSRAAVCGAMMDTCGSEPTGSRTGVLTATRAVPGRTGQRAATCGRWEAVQAARTSGVSAPAG